jgi:hypothetical protein
MVIEIAGRLIAASGLLQEVSVVSAPSAAGRLGTERERPTTGVSELFAQSRVHRRLHRLFSHVASAKAGAGQGWAHGRRQTVRCMKAEELGYVEALLGQALADSGLSVEEREDLVFW